MLKRIQKILKDYYRIESVTPDSNFKKDFGLTSFDFVNLICLMEEQFGVEIEEKDYRRLNTIDELICYLEEKNPKLVTEN